MFSFKGKNTKMVMCFLAFLFFGFILFNCLGKNMEGFGPTRTPSRPTTSRPRPTTPTYTPTIPTPPGHTPTIPTPPGSTGCYDKGVVRYGNNTEIKCSDGYPRPYGIFNSCNTSDKYVCTDTGGGGSGINSRMSRLQWVRARP